MFFLYFSLETNEQIEERKGAAKSNSDDSSWKNVSKVLIKESEGMVIIASK